LADLVREIFGNPFSPPTPGDSVRLTCNNALILHLAQAIYDDRGPGGTFDPDTLGILCDVFEEVSTDSSLLTHLEMVAE
jgi:hypothetical protein